MYGTYNPNASVVKNIKQEYDEEIIQKIKVLGLIEPSFEYTNDVQFVQKMHKCIDFLNMTISYDKKINMK